MLASRSERCNHPNPCPVTLIASSAGGVDSKTRCCPIYLAICRRSEEAQLKYRMNSQIYVYPIVTPTACLLFLVRFHSVRLCTLRLFRSPVQWLHTTTQPHYRSSSLGMSSASVPSFFPYNPGAPCLWLIPLPRTV